MDLILVDVRSGRRRTFPLGERPMLLGRGVDCDVVLPDPEIEEHCCRIADVRGAVRFESLAPEGATINGFAVRTAEVHSGDVIRVGPFQLVIAEGDRAAAAFSDEVPSGRAAPPPRPREEPRPVSTRRRPARKSNVGVIVSLSIVAAGAIGGGVWFWKTHLSTPAPAPTDVAKHDDDASANGPDATKGDDPAARGDSTASSSPSAPATENGAPAASDPPKSESANGANGAAIESGNTNAGSNGHGTPPSSAIAESGGEAAKPAVSATNPATGPTPSDELWSTMQRVTRLLEAEEYSRCRWLLSQTKPGTPKEQQGVAALKTQVDATAAKAGDEYLAFAEKLVAKGWVMPALNHLQDDAIDRFRGLEVWYRMTERADQLEDEVDKVVTADRRPTKRVKHSRPRPRDLASLPPPQIGVTDTEREWDDAAHATAGTAASKPAPAPARADPLTEARRALDGLRFEEAAVVLDTMPRSQLAESREAKRRRLATWAAAAKRASGAGKEAVEAKAAADKLAAARAADHSSREWLDVAWLALAARDPSTFELAVGKAAEEPNLKDEVDSALAFRGGLESVPAGGFVLADGRWVSAAERDAAVARTALTAALASLAKVHEGGMRDATARLVEAAKASPKVAAEMLRARAAELGKKLAECPEKAGLDALRVRVQALADARAAALAFAFDDDAFPPLPGTDVAALKKVADGDKELDKRLQAVRALWGNERGAAPEPSVDLSDDFTAQLRQAQAVQAALRAIQEPAPDDPEFAAARLLPSFTSKVTVRNCALNVEERQRIDDDRDVKARNQVAKDLKNSAELELLFLIASYREMLGVPQVAFDPKLYGDARAYCELMAPQAKKDKDDAPQPEPRLPAEQPKLLAGEVYLRGKFSAQQALTAWQRLPGANRALLFARQHSLGPANVGNFWTCTFGLVDPGK